MEAGCRNSAHGASMLVLTMGLTVVGLCTSVFAIDLPAYFNARNQLQTAVDAAALSGAYQLPISETAAEEAAYEVAAENMVAGQTLSPEDLTFSSSSNKFTVTGKVEVPTIMGKVLCAFSGKTGGNFEIEEEGTGSSPGAGGGMASCSTMTVVAGSTAAPAARDTILVIDTSNSMDDLGNGRPMKDVKKAAVSYINMISAMESESVDRIGLVTFDQTGVTQKTLKSAVQDPGFNSLITKVNGLKLFSGTGWNTNYEPGLRLALDELQNNGRKNADKIVIFMTDGMPNLPAPANYYQYDSNEPYRKCIDPVHSSSQVKALCVTKNGRKVCPTLPSSQITNSMISSTAVNCATTYVNYMLTVTNAQADRAKNMDVTIHTVNINDTNGVQNSEAILQRLLKNPNWQPNQLNYMATETKGEKYEAANYDAEAIQEIYETIAQDIHIKLVN